MKETILLILSFLVANIALNAQTLEWAKSNGGTGDDYGAFVGVDVTGNVYTLGYFEGTVDFDPNVGVSNLTSNGKGDFSIQKLDSKGNLIWVKSIGGLGIDYAQSLAFDVFGDIYVTGSFEKTVDFDPNAGVHNLTSAGKTDIFVQKLDSGGNLLWVKSMGSIEYDMGKSITVDGSGNVYITGGFRKTVDFDPNAGKSNLTNISPNVDAMFVQKLDQMGNLIWAKGVTGGVGVSGQSIKTDALGNVYTTGYFGGTIDFDPNIGVYNLESKTHNTADIFVQKLDASGELIWAKSMGGRSFDVGGALEVDDLGNVYTLGYFNYTVDFDPNAGVTNLTAKSIWTDIFIQKLDANGDFIWARSMGGESNDYGWSLAIDASGNIYSTGDFSGTVDFDPNAGTDSLISGGLRDVFVQKLNSDGDLIWVKPFGSIGNDFARSIAVGDSNSVYITGNFEKTVDFDPNSGTSNLTANGSSDIFILKFSDCASYKALSTSICQGDSFLFATRYLKLTGTYFDTLLNSRGCDSVNKLKLKVNTPSLSTDSQKACDQFTWINGITYTASNSIAQHVLTNSFGCDSVVTLNLNLLKSSSHLDTQFACKSFQWIDGRTYTQNNTSASVILANKLGCDSIVQLNLVISDIDANVAVYPNPTKGLLNVDLGNLNNVSLNVFDVRGRLVYSDKNVKAPIYELMLDVAKGVYLVKVDSYCDQKVYKVIKI